MTRSQLVSNLILIVVPCGIALLKTRRKTLAGSPTNSTTLRLLLLGLLVGWVGCTTVHQQAKSEVTDPKTGVTTRRCVSSSIRATGDARYAVERANASAGAEYDSAGSRNASGEANSALAQNLATLIGTTLLQAFTGRTLAPPSTAATPSLSGPMWSGFFTNPPSALGQNAAASNHLSTSACAPGDTNGVAPPK